MKGSLDAAVWMDQTLGRKPEIDHSSCQYHQLQSFVQKMVAFKYTSRDAESEFLPLWNFALV
jgi:hypothetical protein